MNITLANAIYYRTVHLKGIEVSVLLTLALAAKDESTLPSPSIKRLADRSGFSVGAVKAAIRSLETQGILHLAKRVTESGQSCNVYQVAISALGRQETVAESVACEEVKSSPHEPLKGSSPDHMDTTRTLKSSSHDHMEGSQGFTRVHKSSPGDHYNNINNNIDNNIDNNTQGKAKVIESIKRIQEPALQEERLTPKVCKLEAKARLVAQGMSEDDAESRLAKVVKDFISKAKALKASGELDAKSSPKAYLVAMLTSMAKEGPKPLSATVTATTADPRTVDGILQALVGEFRGKYPYHPGDISYIIDHLPANIVTKLRSLEGDDWTGIRSPLAMARAMIAPFVAEQVVQDCKESLQGLIEDRDMARRAAAECRRDGNESKAADYDAMADSCQARINIIRKAA